MLKKKVLALVRVSTKGQASDEKDGIPRQLRDIEDHCNRHGLTVDEQFELAGISGSYVDRSPKFQRMLKRLEEPGIAGVVFSRMDRFFRPEALSSYRIFETFERTKKLMYCDLGALSQHSQQDRMTIQVWAMVAGQEKANIKYRMQDGKNASRRNPNRKTDSLPFFVTFTQTDPSGNGVFSYTDGDRVQLAFQRVLAGETIRSIASELGFKSPTALRLCLKNPWAYGYKNAMNARDYGEQRRTNEDGELMDAKRRVRRQDPILTRTNLADDPLVSKAVFDRVQSKLDGNQKNWTQRRSQSHRFLGHGLLHCNCGERMYLKMDRRPGKPDYYICATRFNGKTPCDHPSLNAQQTETAIWWSVQSYFTDPKFLTKKLASMQDTTTKSKHEQELRVAEKILAETESLWKQARKNALRDESWFLEEQQLRVQLATDKARVEQLQATIQEHLTAEDIDKTTQDLLKTFEDFSNWPFQKQKETLKQNVVRIRIEDNGLAELTVAFGMPVPSFASKRSKHENFRERILTLLRTGTD